MRARAVILDLDGLLVDTEPLHQRAFNAMLSRHGIDGPLDDDEYGRHFVGVPLVQSSRYVESRFHLRPWDKVVAEKQSIYEELIREPANLVLMPGVRNLLEALAARGVVLGVGSGSPRSHVETILRGLGIESRFQVVVAGTDVLRNKPAPDVYLRAVQELGLPPALCVAVEDSATGIAAAKAAGLRTIVVPSRYTLAQDLSQADARVQNIERVIDWI